MFPLDWALDPVSTLYTLLHSALHFFPLPHHRHFDFLLSGTVRFPRRLSCFGTWSARPGAGFICWVSAGVLGPSSGAGFRIGSWGVPLLRSLVAYFLLVCCLALVRQFSFLCSAVLSLQFRQWGFSLELEGFSWSGLLDLPSPSPALTAPTHRCYTPLL